MDCKDDKDSKDNKDRNEDGWHDRKSGRLSFNETANEMPPLFLFNDSVAVIFVLLVLGF